MINPYAIGKNIYLRAPCLSDVDGMWYQWFSDLEVTQYLGERFWPNTKESQMEFYESTKNSKDRMVLSICLKETDEHIGVCNLSFISWVHRHADIAVVIGEKEHRNGPIAIDVMTLLLEIAFNRLNLLNLRTSHSAANPYTPLLEKMFGFREAGRFKEMSYFQGEYVDAVFSQLSRLDWAKRNKC